MLIKRATKTKGAPKTGVGAVDSQSRRDQKWGSIMKPIGRHRMRQHVQKFVAQGIAQHVAHSLCLCLCSARCCCPHPAPGHGKTAARMRAAF